MIKQGCTLLTAVRVRYMPEKRCKEVSVRQLSAGGTGPVHAGKAGDKPRLLGSACQSSCRLVRGLNGDCWQV